MKKRLLLLFSLAILFAGCKKSGGDDPQIDDPTDEVEGISFACSIFESMLFDLTREHVPSPIDTNGDGKISVEEAAAVTSLDLSGDETAGQTLTTLEDIVHFPNLTSLDCSDNELTELELGSNTSLTEVDCSNNQITDLDVTELTDLADGGLSCDNQTDASGEETIITVTINSDQEDILVEGTSENVVLLNEDDTDTDTDPDPDTDPDSDTDTTPDPDIAPSVGDATVDGWGTVTGSDQTAN